MNNDDQPKKPSLMDFEAFVNATDKEYMTTPEMMGEDFLASINLARARHGLAPLDDLPHPREDEKPR